ncbi:Bicoid-interacting protein 3-domain-containing protein, partial [Vararia minispora EC-137]
YLYHRPGGSDPRLSLLPSKLFQDGRILDIGCNEGWTSCEIGAAHTNLAPAQSRGARYVVGVDIDDALVRMAWKRRRTLWSLQEPAREPEVIDTGDARPKKKRRTIGETSCMASVQGTHSARKMDYFPASCVHMFGFLPIPTERDASHTALSAPFPHNVVFRCADWVNQPITDDSAGYNTILALSVSKWIHLNGGDEGLRRFFQRVYDCLVPGGTFVFEPQPWDSYTKARKLTLSLQGAAKKLKLRPDGFAVMLMNIGFGAPLRIGVPGEGRFRRPVELYEKPINDSA